MSCLLEEGFEQYRPGSGLHQPASNIPDFQYDSKVGKSQLGTMLSQIETWTWAFSKYLFLRGINLCTRPRHSAQTIVDG